MNEREGLNLLDFLPTGINKNDPVIQAIFSDFEGEGAAAREIEELIAFINYYTRTADVKNHQGASLEMIVKLFAGLRRQIEESDGQLLRRMRALTERKGDAIWGNALDMKHVFEVYFADIEAFVYENTNEESILPNGDFEEDGAWEFEGGAALDSGARFSGKRGLYLTGTPGELCTQHIDRWFISGVYTFHFFLKGRCGVIIKNEAGQYWNADERILAWTDTEVVNSFSRTDWDDAFCFIVLPAAMQRLTVQFTGVEGEEAYIDYARLFVKPENPSYTIVIQYEGYTVAEKTMHLGAGSEDPDQGIDYAQERYFDHAYIVGLKGSYRSEVYRWVLDIVRPRGIQAFVEFVEKTQEEQEGG